MDTRNGLWGEVIQMQRIRNAQELLDYLATLKELSYNLNTMYVVTKGYETTSKATIIEAKLTDGSKTYDILLS